MVVPSHSGAKVELFEVLPVGQSAEPVESRSPGREGKPRPVSKEAQLSVVLPEVPLPGFEVDRSEECASGQPIIDNPGKNGLGELQQNFLERSNVEVVNELVNLIIGQRAYEVNSRAIRASDDMLTQAVAIIR